MFLPALHSRGRPVSFEWPDRSGPRNCGQSAAAVALKTVSAVDTRQITLIVGTLYANRFLSTVAINKTGIMHASLILRIDRLSLETTVQSRPSFNGLKSD